MGDMYEERWRNARKKVEEIVATAGPDDLRERVNRAKENKEAYRFRLEGRRWLLEQSGTAFDYVGFGRELRQVAQEPRRGDCRVPPYGEIGRSWTSFAALCSARTQTTDTRAPASTPREFDANATESFEKPCGQERHQTDSGSGQDDEAERRDLGLGEGEQPGP